MTCSHLFVKNANEMDYLAELLQISIIQSTISKILLFGTILIGHQKMPKRKNSDISENHRKLGNEKGEYPRPFITVK